MGYHFSYLQAYYALCGFKVFIFIVTQMFFTSLYRPIFYLFGRRFNWLPLQMMNHHRKTYFVCFDCMFAC